MSSVSQIAVEVSAISYEIEHEMYTLCNKEWQWLVFKQVEKDASMVGLQLDWKPDGNLQSWYDALKQLLTQLLMLSLIHI